MTAAVAGVAVLLAVLLAWPDDGRRLRRLLDGSGPVHRRSAHDDGLAWWGLWRVFGRRPVARREVRPALVLDLVAAALTAGSPPEVALKVVGQAVGGSVGDALVRVADRLRLGSRWERAWEGSPDELEPLRRSLAIARAAGAPAAGLLNEAAQDQRRRVHRTAQVQAARLGVRLVLPLGLCALPAFVCWAVVPVVLSLAGDLVQGP